MTATEVVQGLLWPWKIDLANYNDSQLKLRRLGTQGRLEGSSRNTWFFSYGISDRGYNKELLFGEGSAETTGVPQINEIMRNWLGGYKWVELLFGEGSQECDEKDESTSMF